MATDNHHERAETHRLLYVFYQCNLPNQFSTTVSRTHENVVFLHHEPFLNGAIHTHRISKIQLTILNVARNLNTIVPSAATFSGLYVKPL